MLSVTEALHRLLASFNPLEFEEVPVQEAGGRILAKDILAEFDLPQFANSAVDGFALRASDLQSEVKHPPVKLRVIADIPAGTFPTVSLGTGQAARIMTGAALPAGADEVIPVELTNFNFREPGLPLPEFVEIHAESSGGLNIRIRGQDVQQGEQVLPRGRRLRAQEIGLLCMLGISQVPVQRKARLAVLSSGDELLKPGEALLPGKIYDSNTAMISQLAIESGSVVVYSEVAKDNEDSIRKMLDNAIQSSVDLIVTTAGVSVGAFDFMRSVVAEHGQLEFWRVAMRPGKPFAFGSYRGVPFFGLPGNPVSAFVGFEVLVKPALGVLNGEEVRRNKIKVNLGEELVSDGRESYLRAVIEAGEKPVAVLTGHQGSGNLRSLVQANALLIVPSGVKSLPAGAELEAWLISS
jgi:molybdopterin molybdotransferase